MKALVCYHNTQLHKKTNSASSRSKVGYDFVTLGPGTRCAGADPASKRVPIFSLAVASPGGLRWQASL